MKNRIFLATLFILFTSFSFVDNVDLEQYHLKRDSRDNVERFYKNHKEIYSNREVYIAYLGKFFNVDEDEFICLILK